MAVLKKHKESEGDEPKAPKRYLVKHTGVGPWTQGRVIDETDLAAFSAEGDPIDVDRLLAVGALEATKEEVSEEPVDIGPANPAPPPELPEGRTKDVTPKSGSGSGTASVK